MNSEVEMGDDLVRGAPVSDSRGCIDFLLLPHTLIGIYNGGVHMNGGGGGMHMHGGTVHIILVGKEV
jgi:hypothetical protein